ncbi:hypothetical protein HYT84_03430 [Candidatus Micrarchaeota archaeon]|nr:hypothetical protein [Candidatus Micrarchaeota archaeon]
MKGFSIRLIPFLLGAFVCDIPVIIYLTGLSLKGRFSEIAKPMPKGLLKTLQTILHSILFTIITYFVSPSFAIGQTIHLLVDLPSHKRLPKFFVWPLKIGFSGLFDHVDFYFWLFRRIGIKIKKSDSKN